MKLIVGLGNPGKDYQNTRHNVGFMILDQYAKRVGKEFSKNKFNGMYFETIIDGEKIIFLKPQKYMNLSGEVVSEYVKFYKINIDDVLIIHDDLDVELGNIKIKMQGSCGGHNGLRNIEENLQTSDYKRIKIGISNQKEIETKDYVLGSFKKDEKAIMDKIIETSCTIIDDYFELTFANLMNKYN